MKQLNKYASKGYQVAFASKSNKDKYVKLLQQHGYKASVMRSSGPTIDKNPNKTKSYYVMPVKDKVRKQIERKATRKIIKPQRDMFSDFAGF